MQGEAVAITRVLLAFARPTAANVVFVAKRNLRVYVLLVTCR